MPQISPEDVAATFKSYGLDLSPAEIGIFAGSNSGPELAQAMANFAATKTAQIKAEANNPLKDFLDSEKTRRADFETKANDLYGKLQDTISAAPKLFGNLSPDQIDQYIAPITQAAREGSANLEGDYARRNIAGSSIEANALADANRKYRENVLNTGLNLGMQTQQAQAAAMQQRINQLFGASGQSSNLIGGGAGQLTTDQMNNMHTITQLPYFLQAMMQQQELFKKQMEGPSLWDKIDRGINTGSNLFNFASGADAVGKMMGGGKGGKDASIANMGTSEGSASSGAEAAMLF